MSFRSFRLAAPFGALLLLTAPAPVQAQARTSAPDMTVQQFLTAGADIPRNRAAAILRPDTRRLIGVAKRAVSTVKAEQAAALAAGRQPAHCIPASGTGITPENLVARFEAMPEAGRRITVTQAVRDWMAERFPCRA